MKELNMGAGYQRSAVPGPSRENCTYGQDYAKKPLYDAPVTTELRNFIAESSRRGERQEVKGAAFSSDTTHKAHYSEPVSMQPRAEPVKPMNLIRIKAGAKLGESQTITSKDYSYPNEVQARKGRGHLSRPIDARLPTKARFEGESLYKREYAEDRYLSHGRLGAGLRSRSMAALEAGRRAQAYLGS